MLLFGPGNRKFQWHARVIPNGKMKSFYHSDLPSCRRRAKRAGCARARSRNICFGTATLPQQEKKQLGRYEAGQSKYYRLYLYSGKVALAAMYLGESESMAAALRRALQH